MRMDSDTKQDLANILNKLSGSNRHVVRKEEVYPVILRFLQVQPDLETYYVKFSDKTKRRIEACG